MTASFQMVWLPVILPSRRAAMIRAQDEMTISRLVYKGRKDKAESLTTHYALALRQRSTMLLVSASAVLGLQLFLHEVDQTYRQSYENLKRDVYRKLSREY